MQGGVCILVGFLIHSMFVGAVPVRQGQDIRAEQTARPAVDPTIVNEINSDENTTWYDTSRFHKIG